MVLAAVIVHTRHCRSKSSSADLLSLTASLSLRGGGEGEEGKWGRFMGLGARNGPGCVQPNKKWAFYLGFRWALVLELKTGRGNNNYIIISAHSSVATVIAATSVARIFFFLVR